MATVTIGCAKQVEEDESITLIIEVRGLSADEATIVGPMLEVPCKAAIKLATAGRHLPGTYEYDPATGEKTFIKPETRQ